MESSHMWIRLSLIRTHVERLLGSQNSYAQQMRSDRPSLVLEELKPAIYTVQSQLHAVRSTGFFERSRTTRLKTHTGSSVPKAGEDC